MPMQKMFRATATRTRQVKCPHCGHMYTGYERATAISDVQPGAMGKDQAQELLRAGIETGNASWQADPCRCPLCRRFSGDTVGVVRLTWGILVIIVVGVTSAIVFTHNASFAYFFLFAIYPIRSLVRFYRN